jgi:hypothetical protein
MSPCCIAAAAATAVLTALVIVALTTFVLVTDSFGLGLLAATLLAVAFQRTGSIGPVPRLLYAYSALLVVRAAWLLATTRRPLVVAVLRLVEARVAVGLRRATPGRFRRAHTRHRGCAAHDCGRHAPSRTGPGAA